MQQSSIVHPRLMAMVARNFYPSLCTIQTPGATQDQYGQETGPGADLPGHVDIPCRIAPVLAPSEQRTPSQIYVVGQYNVALNGYYPAIVEKMIAVVDGKSYDIDGIGHDGNHSMTHLTVRLVS